MKRSLTTNSRLVNDVLTAYRNTYKALCELINNSIQAEAKTVRLTIDYADVDNLLSSAFTRIVIWDDGWGVSVDEIQNKLLDIATTNKQGGKGVGRFAAFQIGNKFTIDTVGYSLSSKSYSHANIPLQSSDFKEKPNISEVNIDTVEEILNKRSKTYYEVTIEDLYDETVVKLDVRRKLTSHFAKDKIKDSLFETYCLKIFNKEIKIYVNDELIDPNNYILGKPLHLLNYFTDKRGENHQVQMDYINIKSLNKIRVYLTKNNAGIHDNAVCFEYKADWLNPDIGGWLIYFYGEDIPDEVFHNMDFGEMDEQVNAYRAFIKQELTNFFRSKNKKFEEFLDSLHEDKYYPLKEGSFSSAQLLTFDRLAYMAEDKYALLKKNNQFRSVIYSVIDKSINDGKIEFILKEVLKLPKKTVNQFSELLQRSELEDVIGFSNKVSSKLEELDFLEKLTGTEISKHIKERKELHKFLVKMLWIFGEQYNENTTLLSDTNLENNLRKLRDDCMGYKYSANDDNGNNVTASIKNITDLFMYSTRILTEQKREVLVVELKAPRVKISQKEIQQVQKYALQIKESDFSPADVNFKIILVSSSINNFVQTMSLKNMLEPTLLWRSEDRRIEIHVLKWADIIEKNKRRLQYMSNHLKTKDVDVFEKAKKDFPEIDFSLNSSLTKKPIR